MCDHAFLVILPEASTPEFLSFTRDFLDQHDITVEEESTVGRDELERGRCVEKQYSLVQTFALADSAALTSLIHHSEEVKSRFFDVFNELWDAVVEEGRLLSAKDAMTFYGDLSPSQLECKWWRSFQPQETMQQVFHAPVKLMPGLYLARFGDEPYYVVNGFYPGLAERWNLGPRRHSVHTVTWMALSWEEGRYSVESLERDIFGVQDPEAANPSSLRRLMFSRYDAFNIYQRPSVERYGFEISTSPVEALAQHCMWSRRPFCEMAFGRSLLQEGLPPLFIERALSNPVIISAGVVSSVFETTSGMCDSKAVRRLGELYWSLKEADEEYRSDVEQFGEDAARRRIFVYDVLKGSGQPFSITEGCEDEVATQRNSAVVFVKPHAYKKVFFAALEEMLAQLIPGMQLDHVIDVEAHLVETRNIIDRHYGIISHYAMTKEPSTISVSAQAEQKFEETFGVRWRDAALSGRVWNAKVALQLLGHISPKALYELWNDEPIKVKIASGAYICRLPLEGGGAFIINGFYPYVKEMFTASGARTRCYIISWPEAALSWKEFRNDVVGCTNPAMAPPTSLRGLLYREWQAFGLESAPDTTANGVHASAGPVEAMVERNLWFGIPYELDVLTQQVIRRGLSPATLYWWTGNPVVTVGDKTDMAFDVLENRDTSDVVALMKEAEEILAAQDSDTALNHGVVFLHPHSTTSRTIGIVRDVLNRAGITITAEHNVFAHQATAAILDTRSMRDVARYSSLSGETLMNAVSHAGRDAFEEFFSINWEDNCDIVMGADEALGVLNVSPYELMTRFSESKSAKIERHVHAAFLEKEKIYVINGFYPFLNETYTKPGSCMHVLEVSWRESEWSWEDFNNVVIGDRDVRKSLSGSLQRIISENWKDFGLARRSVYLSQCNISASKGPLEAVGDRLRWFVPAVDRPKKLLEDRFIQQVLAHHVPLEQIKYLMEGYQNISSSLVLQQERAVLDHLSTNQQTSAATRRLQTYSTALRDALRQEYGFIWVQPSACTKRVEMELPAFLASKHIRIIEKGAVDIETAMKRNLLNSPTDSLYRNAIRRQATEMPITPQEKVSFKAFFNMDWDTAVQLCLILNSAQHVARVGLATAIEQWESAVKKTCISPSMYIAYIASEGLYVVNGFYSFLQSRLSSGPRVLWYCVSWETENMSYEKFLSEVIGEQDPSVAQETSFRRVLLENWQEWKVPMPPDALENGIYACRTPLEALSERCRWLQTLPEEDVYGRLLLQHGVHAKFLHDSLKNPLVHLKGDSRNHITEMFDLMPLNCSSVCDTLLALQYGYELTFLPDDTIITEQRPNAILALDDDGLWEEPENCTAEEREEFKANKEMTLVLRRGVSTAYEYSEPLAEPVPMAARQWWLAGKTIRRRIPQASKDALQYSFAILSISPSFVAGVGDGITTAIGLLKDLLRAHSIEVLVERDVPGLEADARRVFDHQFERLVRYTCKQPGSVSITPTMREEFERETGIAVDPTQVRNALELSSEFNLTARKLERVWEMCTTQKRLGTDLFLAKVPTEDLFVVNGFGLQFKETFMNQQQPKRFLLVSWDSQVLSYQKFMEEVIGDRFVVEAQPTSFHGILRDDWGRLGFAQGPHAYMGVVSASESALNAMQQRQAWLGTGLLTDPLGREAISTGVVSPLILRQALRNPPTEPDGTPLLDVLNGEDGAKTLQKLREMELAYRSQPVRNTAFALVKPHALCKRFAKRVEHIFAKHNIRIEEQGDITGTAVHDRGLVRYLYPAAAGYAVRNPTSLILTEEEQRRIYDGLKITWEEFVLSDMLLNAYKALEVLGGITPQQLYVMWKSSRHRVLVRPDLEITELEDHHIFVVNAFFPALKQSFETPSALLHWYVISWAEKDLSWAEFNKSVCGSRQPSKAEKDSIRGHLYRHWREYGLHAIPDRIQNGIHISEGPLQGLGERLTFLERPISEDPLGEILERMNVHPGLLESWLDNPDVQVHQTTAGVFEHVINYDTSRLVRTLEFLSDDIKAREACREQGIEYETASMAPEESTLSVGVEEEEEMSVEEEVETMNMSWRSDLPWTEEPIVYRNTSVLFLKPSVTSNPEVRNLLLKVLKRNNVRVVNEVDKESTTALIDRICFTQSFFAMRSNVCDTLLNGQDVTQTAKRTFKEVFGETWEDVTNPECCRLVSATDAMGIMKLSARELYSKTCVPGQLGMSLSGDIHVVQVKGTQKKEPLYVINASYPYYRQRMENVDGNRALDIIVVSFDGREHSWKDFREEVIGNVNPAKAAEGSFRRELLLRWKALNLESPPNEIDNGVHDSTGPLQAFAERLVLFGTSDLIPDPLVRSMCMADADPLLLVDWSENPLVAYTSSYSHGEEKKDLKPKICRVFDLLYEIDTRDLSELIRTAESHIQVLSRPKDLRLPDLRPDRFRPPQVPLSRRLPKSDDANQEQDAIPEVPTEKKTEKTLADPIPLPTSAADAANSEVAAGDIKSTALPATPEEGCAASPPPPRPRIRRRLNSAVIQDAIINAHSPEDVKDLWEYYRNKSSCPDKKERHNLAGFGKLVEVPATIDFELFYKDFKGLEMFGAPLDRRGTELYKLFQTVQESGQMNYNQFARALALYQII